MRFNTSFAATALFLAISANGHKKLLEGASCVNFDDCADGLKCDYVISFSATGKYCMAPDSQVCYYYDCLKQGYTCNVSNKLCEPTCKRDKQCARPGECCGTGTLVDASYCSEYFCELK